MFITRIYVLMFVKIAHRNRLRPNLQIESTNIDTFALSAAYCNLVVVIKGMQISKKMLNPKTKFLICIPLLLKRNKP